MTQLRLPREPMPLDDMIIQSPRDMLRAFVIAAEIGQLDDQQAAAAAGMDPSTWSQFKNGARGIKPLEFNTYLDQCGNHLPLEYWAYTRGLKCVPMETEMQRRVRERDEQIEKLQEENRVLRSLFHGRAA